MIQVGGNTLNLTNTGAIAFTGVGARTLALNAFGTGRLTLSASLGDGAGGATSLAFTTDGLLTLDSAASSYTGPTSVSGGVLAVRTLANGGVSSSIGASGNTAGNLILNPGAVRYTGAGASTDRLFTMGVGVVTLQNLGTGNLSFTNTGAVAFVGNGGRTLALEGFGVNTFAPSVADGPGGATSLGMGGSGTWVLTNANTFTGPTSVTAGELRVGHAAALQNSTVNVWTEGRLTFGVSVATIRGLEGFGTVAFSNDVALTVGGSGADTTFSGTMIGNGSLTKVGGGTLVLASAPSHTGGTAVNAGTLQVDNGFGGAGGAVTVAAGATLLAKGTISRAVSGGGTVTANAAPLVLGDLTNPAGFDLGGPAGVGGTLNVGGNTVVLFSQGDAVLGSATNLSAGGTLVTVNGLRLGGAASVDATKVLTATGAAVIQGAFTNNGVVNGPTAAGQFLTMQNLVDGAGSFTGNVVFNGGWSPGNSPAAVTVGDAALGGFNILTMELGGVAPGSGHDTVAINGVLTLGGTLHVRAVGGFVPDAGDSFLLFDGATAGVFSNILLPTPAPGLAWDTSLLYSAGLLSVQPVPEPTAAVPAWAAAAVWLLLHRKRRRRAGSQLGS